ncbi:MAG: cache domain-containing protein [Bacteroidota bacterium]
MKIIWPTLFTVVLFIMAFFFFLIPGYERSIISGKEETMKELTDMAWSILSLKQEKIMRGELSQEEARQSAIQEIGLLRYGPERKDYFWITDTVPVMIMHPYRSDLNGSNVADFTDPEGKRLFSEFVQIARDKKQGFSEYYWQWKDDPDNIVPKRSYVKLFEPWGWIIGTGIYLDDARRDVKQMTKKFLSISVLITLAGMLMLAIMILQNISIENQRRKAVRSLEISEKNLRELNETKDRLFSIIAHDLRSPFSTIMGFSEILSRDPDSLEPENKNALFRHLHDQVKRTLQLLDNLLNWAKAQTGQMKNIPERFDLPVLINESISELILTAGNKKVSLVFEPERSIMVNTDPDLLRIVLRNLLTNAIKFTFPGGQVSVCIHQDINRLTTISVEDNGTGMSPVEVENLFTDNNNESRAGTAREKGSGLGLVICRQVVEIMGGKIWAISEPGKGSIFNFTITDPG